MKTKQPMTAEQVDYTLDVISMAIKTLNAEVFELRKRVEVLVGKLTDSDEYDMSQREERAKRAMRIRDKKVERYLCDLTGETEEENFDRKKGFIDAVEMFGILPDSDIMEHKQIYSIEDKE